VKKQNPGATKEDLFEAARRNFFSEANGDAAASPRKTFTQLKSYDGPLVGQTPAKTARIHAARPELEATP
jgi:hypothetical protein